METNREELINNFIPDYQDIVDEIDNFTDEEIDIILKYGEGYGFPDCYQDLNEYVTSSIQNEIIQSLIELEFINKKDAYEFCDKYEEYIFDFCIDDTFISRNDPGTYYIYIDETKSFVERIFEDEDDEFSDWESKIKKNINYLEIINELNKNFNGLKFII